MSVWLKDVIVLAVIFGWLALYCGLLILAADGMKHKDRKEAQ